MKPHHNSRHNNLNIFGELNLKITFNILVFSIVVSTFATILHALIPEKYKDTLTFAATTFATSAGALGAFYAYRSLSQNTNSKVMDRSLLYLQRWNDAQYIPLREASLKIFEEIRRQLPEQQEVFLTDYFEKNPVDKQKIITILNFLTEMALCIEEGIVSERFLKKYFKVIVHDYYECFYGFIIQRRANGHSNSKEIYRALIELYRAWED